MKAEIFQGANLQWYWRVKAKNGQIIATGGEGYTRRFSAQRGFRRFMSLRVVEVST